MSKELINVALGPSVRVNAKGMLSLTDLHKASGASKGLNPAKWQETEAAKAFIEATAQILNIPIGDIIESKRGKAGGTYAHKQIALAYAKALSPDLHYAVNQAFFERLEEEANPDKIIDRGIATYKKQGHTEEWIADRLSGKASRVALCSTLSRHGVTNKGFGPCTNAIYTALYGGGADKVREKKNLPAKANPRDHMGRMELSALMFAENLAAESIERKNINGDKPCEYACFNAAKQVADLVIANRKAA